MIQLRLFGCTDLRNDKGGEALSVLAQPKRLALLAWLALARPRGYHRRDSIVALFWPELDAEHARASLRKTVFHLRQALGADVIVNRGDEEVGLGAGFWCDAVAFQDAVAAGRAAEALELYRGDLLPGFFLTDVPEWEQWLEEERDRLRRQAVAAAWTLAEEAESGQRPDSVEWAYRAVALAPADEAALRRLLSLLERCGDSGGALRVFEEYRSRLADAYGAEPEPSTDALVAAIRARSEAARPSGHASARGHAGTRSFGDAPARGNADARSSGDAPVRGYADARSSGDAPVRGYADARSSGDAPVRGHADARSSGDAPVREYADARSSGDAPVRGDADAPAAVPPVGGDAPPPPSGEPPARGATARRSRWLVAAAVTAAALGAVLVFALWPRAGGEEPVTVAIGHIRDFTEPGASSVAEALPDLLATNLSRAAEIHVVSPARLHELLARRNVAGGAAAGGAAVLAAARQAGADQLVEGALYQQSDGNFRLDLRRVSLRGGGVLSSHTVLGPDIFAVVDGATTEILDEWGAGSTTLRIADVTTRSLVAYRFYQQGLRFYFRGDTDAALRLFEAALEEDTTFAMAAYYAAQSASGDGPRARQYLARAVAMFDHATPRERLLIRVRAAEIDDDPARLAIAETLAVRYPMEPEAQMLYGRMLTWSGDFEAAIVRLRRSLSLDDAVPAALALDTAAHPHGPASCNSCSTFNELVTAYALADSLPAAEAVAREWLRRVPTSLGALDALAKTLEYQDRVAEAMTVRRSASSQHPTAGVLGVGMWPGVYGIRAGDWDAADGFLRLRAEVGTRAERHEALWLLVVSLRHQGRFDEALATARQLRGLQNPPHVRGAPPPYNALTEATVLFEMGRPRDAAALWDSIARQVPIEPGRPTYARQRAWLYTHAATALHAAGDTVALKRLAVQIEAHGRQSAYGRDHRLHHHARGLLYAARGDDARAAAEFRSAIFSTTAGYTRTNLELGRALLRLGRPAEAIPVLRSAFRGPLGASNLYLTHTDLREALGAAFMMAGQRDSAAVHACWIARARRNADRGVAERARHAMAGAAALECPD
jgi:DNA-binding SARP family transcriptional activator/tetratricopeptide (TPR) repeat protein